MDTVERATQVAAEAHKEQLRKSDDTPYIAHSLAVARILDKHGFSDEVVAAAVLHDVIEDTGVTEGQLRNEFGDVVTDMVCGVSEDKSLPWKERKIKYIETIKTADENIKAVSLADKIHNGWSLVDAHATYGTEIWTKFRKGKEETLWFLNALLQACEGDTNEQLVREYKRCLDKLNSLD